LDLSNFKRLFAGFAILTEIDGVGVKHQLLFRYMKLHLSVARLKSYAVLQDSWDKSHDGTLCACVNYVIDHVTDVGIHVLKFNIGRFLRAHIKIFYIFYYNIIFIINIDNIDNILNLYIKNLLNIVDIKVY